MTSRKREILEDLPREWVRQRERDRGRDHAPNGASLADEATDLLMEWVVRYDYGAEEIKVLLQIMFGHVARLSRSAGVADGQEHERANNPAIKGYGGVLAAALAADRKARATIAAQVFDAEAARGSNTYFAWAQALKALSSEGG